MKVAVGARRRLIQILEQAAVRETVEVNHEADLAHPEGVAVLPLGGQVQVWPMTGQAQSGVLVKPAYAGKLMGVLDCVRGSGMVGELLHVVASKVVLLAGSVVSALAWTARTHEAQVLLLGEWEKATPPGVLPRVWPRRLYHPRLLCRRRPTWQLGRRPLCCLVQRSRRRREIAFWCSPARSLSRARRVTKR